MEHSHFCPPLKCNAEHSMAIPRIRPAPFWTEHFIILAKESKLREEHSKQQGTKAPFIIIPKMRESEERGMKNISH